MNWNTIIRDAGRIIICAIIVGGYVYCVIIHDSCASVLKEWAIVVLAGQLGLEGFLKWLDGKGNGRYKIKEVD